MHKESKVCIIRPALKSDIKAIVNIENACFDEERFSPRVLAYLVLHSRGGTYVACDENNVVAYVSVLQRAGCRNLRIYSIAVAPQASGRGIGSRLMEFVIAEAQKRGLSFVSLEVALDNMPARAMYDKYGFEPSQLLKAYFRPGRDAYRMLKTIDHSK